MEYFQCKQFCINQNNEVLKVTTEALILGAWVAKHASNPQKILDIGCGTGLLSLMIAQQNNSIIDAVDFDIQAINLANQNLKSATFLHKIKVYHSPIQGFEKPVKSYDLIISNPPFYENHLKSSEQSRNKYIHAHSLPFNDLAKAVIKYLNPNGKFFVLLPPKQLTILENILEGQGLNICSEIHIRHRQNAKILRIIATFGFESKNKQIEDFVIKDSEENYSLQFKDLLLNYYTIF